MIYEYLFWALYLSMGLCSYYISTDTLDCKPSIPYFILCMIIGPLALILMTLVSIINHLKDQL